MTDKFIRLTNWLAKACGVFAAGCLFLSIVIITELVFERYLFKNAITWQTELVTMLLVASTFIGSAYVLSVKGHVNMEYLYTFLSKKNITEIKHKPNAIGIPEKSITTVDTPTTSPNNNGSTI